MRVLKVRLSADLLNNHSSSWRSYHHHMKVGADAYPEWAELFIEGSPLGNRIEWYHRSRKWQDKGKSWG